VYLIDTNVISEIRKGTNGNKGVRKFIKQRIKDESPLHLSAITMGELRRGTEAVRHRGDAPQAAMLEAWIGTILDDYAMDVIPIDDDVAQLWGRLRVPNSENAIDKLIAATALMHDLTVVTRNIKDFEKTGVKLLNPFE
jgi:predicted nucleic acid-binding protein